MITQRRTKSTSKTLSTAGAELRKLGFGAQAPLHHQGRPGDFSVQQASRGSELRIFALAYEVGSAFDGSNIITASIIGTLLFASSTEGFVLAGVRANVTEAFANHVATAVVSAVITFFVDLRLAITARGIQEVRVPIFRR